MLKTILSISMLIVESLADKKKVPAYAKDKVISLGDISIYTQEGETPLHNVLTAIKEKENEGKASIPTSAKPDELYAYFAEILPDFDRDRVHPGDIKKIILWYNLLLDAGMTDFTAGMTDFTPEEVESTDETASEAATEKAEA